MNRLVPVGEVPMQDSVGSETSTVAQQSSMRRPTPTRSRPVANHVVFLELFAGKAGLSGAISALNIRGVETLDAFDVRHNQDMGVLRDITYVAILARC